MSKHTTSILGQVAPAASIQWQSLLISSPAQVTVCIARLIARSPASIVASIVTTDWAE